MIGPGKYDDLCTELRARLGMDEENGGGIALIVFGGNKGSGFSVQADAAMMMLLPDILEMAARQLRTDAENLRRQIEDGASDKEGGKPD